MTANREVEEFINVRISEMDNYLKWAVVEMNKGGTESVDWWRTWVLDRINEEYTEGFAVLNFQKNYVGILSSEQFENYHDKLMNAKRAVRNKVWSTL